jgi:cytochrome bd-type quinol oxidase subunit 2
MSDTPARERRRWADIVVIATGLMLVGFAAWNAPASTGAPDETASLPSLFTAYAAGGALAIVALFVAHRSRTGGRVLIVAAALLLLVFGFDAFRERAAAAWLTVLVPAVLLLGAVPFFGPMPRANPAR